VRVKRRGLKYAAICAVVTLAAACGSANVSSGSGSSSGGQKAVGSDGKIKIGIVLSETGAAASGYTTSLLAVKARIGLANAAGGIDGHQVEYVVADDTGTPQGALTATQELVQRDHVFAIVSNSPYFAPGATDYVKSLGIPALTSGQDGFQYGEPAYRNMFSAFGSESQSMPIASTFGTYWKSLGVTNVGVVGYPSAASSTLSAQAAAKSAEVAGIKVGYANTSLAFGSTDVGPIVLGMKKAGVNAVWLPIISNSAFAILRGLKQNGVTLKSALLPTGYGAELLASPDTIAAAQGVQFTSFGAPVEMNTTATKNFQAALLKYADSSGIPTYAEYSAWMPIDLFLYGLQKAGSDPDWTSYVNALRKVTSYDAGGLLAGKLNFTVYNGQEEGTVANCFFVVTLKGTKFIPDPHASPVCGGLTGQTLSSSS
jgi:ABC-type branched-subunit amino acid transport system substrate-binding protein